MFYDYFAPSHSLRFHAMGGSGKRSLRSLPMVLTHIARAIGKLHLPLPPITGLE